MSPGVLRRDAEAVLAAALGVEQGGIRGIDQGVGRPAVRGRGGDADRDRDALALERVEQAAAEHGRLGGAGGARGERQLVPAQAPGRIRRAGVAAQQPGRGAQDAVAMGVAVRVVQLLEVVDVDHEDADLLVGAAGGAQRGGQAAPERARVGEAGEGVVVGEPAHALVEMRLAQRARAGGRERLAEAHLVAGEGGGVHRIDDLDHAERAAVGDQGHLQERVPSPPDHATRAAPRTRPGRRRATARGRSHRRAARRARAGRRRCARPAAAAARAGSSTCGTRARRG